MTGPVRPWTPDTQVVRDASGVRWVTLSVKRCCNGCQLALGDMTDVELVAAVRGRRLPDVRNECGRCQGRHVVMALPEARSGDWSPGVGDRVDRYVVKCPDYDAPVSPCAVSVPCGCEPPVEGWPSDAFEAFVARLCPESPTGAHVYDAEVGAVVRPVPGTCWYAERATQEGLAVDVGVVPGVYVVEVGAVDAMTPVFTPVTLAPRR